jgi:tRNA threonylcarbamoyl adenosine modification protein (Sua5/YciO/YrdC/YwlC family)
MAKHVYTYINPPSERDLDEACAVLADGGLLAYPTDVNWAIGCDAANSKALDRIRLLKPGHPKEQPFSLICASISMAAKIANIEGSDYRVLKQTLPGPFTFLLQRNRSLPRQIKDKRRTVGIRVPASPLVLALVEKFGRPLATTSLPRQIVGAEHHAATVVKFGYELDDKFGHALDLILDLGTEIESLETTVIDMTEGGPIVVRQGVGEFPQRPSG